MKTFKFYILYIFGLTLTLFMATSAYGASDKNFTVVIDAGHGGHDPGAIGKRGREKNINLNVALKLGKLIEQNCSDTRVVYTRKKDVFVPLHSRADIANNAKADLFISIHTNSVASRNSSVRGTETYTLGLHRTQDNLEVAKKENSVILIEDDYKQRYAGFNPNSSESYIIFEFMQDKNMSQSVSFARLIQTQFRNNAQRVDKGVHQAGFLVLRETTMPSVLVELGYITNRNEEAYLLSESGSSALARSIYLAFMNYRQQRQGNTQVVQADADPKPATATKEKQAPSPTRDDTPGKVDTPADNGGQPVFKIQILTSDRKLPSGSKLFKGLSPVGCYKENGIYKYTYGDSTDYNQVLRLKRNKVDAKFKDAFIIAFKNGEKTNVNDAIKEFKKNRK